MDIFSKNYWSLYINFLNDFEDIKYKGFSIPYLYHFRSLLKGNEKLWDSLYNQAFTAKLPRSITENREIQIVFNEFVQSHTNEPLERNKNGIVIFHDVYNLLKLPQKTFIKYFNSSQVMRLYEGGNRRKMKRRTKAKSYQNIRVLNDRDGNGAKRMKDNKKAKAAGSIPSVKYFSEFSVDTRKAVENLTRKANSIIKKHHNHPLYSQESFKKVFFLQLSKIVNRIEESANLLELFPVSCIVVPSTHYPECRTLALVAAEKGIPTICMQHGIISSEHGYLPKVATVDAVYGQFEVDWYKEKGAADETVEVIGHPRFDQAFEKPRFSRLQFNEKFGLAPNKKNLLIIVRGNKDIDSWRLFIKKISKKLDINILIKDYPNKRPHPLSKEFPSVHSLLNVDLYDILPNVDGAVSYPSTVGLEAMLAGKPVFILNMDFPGSAGYYNRLGELSQNDANQLGDIVIKYFGKEQMIRKAQKVTKDFLSYAYPLPALSGKRLRKLINRLTS